MNDVQILKESQTTCVCEKGKSNVNFITYVLFIHVKNFKYQTAWGNVESGC